MASFESFITSMKNIKSRIVNREDTNSKDTIEIFFINCLCCWLLWLTRYRFKRPQRRSKYFWSWWLEPRKFQTVAEINAEIDINLETQLRTCTRNDIYIPKTTHNNLLSCIKDCRLQPHRLSQIVRLIIRLEVHIMEYQLMEWQTVPIRNSLVLYFDMWRTQLQLKS